MSIPIRIDSQANTPQRHRRNAQLLKELLANGSITVSGTSGLTLTGDALSVNVDGTTIKIVGNTLEAVGSTVGISVATPVQANVGTARVTGTVYQNTTVNPMLVVVGVFDPNTPCYAFGNAALTSAALPVGVGGGFNASSQSQVSVTTGSIVVNIFMSVPAGWFYNVTTQTASSLLVAFWNETQLT